jgi:hypothetical protein
MSIEQTLQKHIEESKRWIDTAEGVYKRDLVKRIELINRLDKVDHEPTSIMSERNQKNISDVV